MSAADGERNTVIAAAPDSRAVAGVGPARGVAAAQSALLAGHACELMPADVVFRTAYRDGPGGPVRRPPRPDAVMPARGPAPAAHWAA